MPDIQLINDSLLDALCRAAFVSPRRRKNHNFHQHYDEPCQRLLNAVDPGSYIRPHRHLTPAKPECFVLLRGRMAALIFADDGRVERLIPLSATDGCLGVDIPAGVWHTIVALASGSVFFETKPGPYQALTDKDFAPWAPVEGSPEAEPYLQSLLEIVEQC